MLMVTAWTYIVLYVFIENIFLTNSSVSIILWYSMSFDDPIILMGGMSED